MKYIFFSILGQDLGLGSQYVSVPGLNRLDPDTNPDKKTRIKIRSTRKIRFEKDLLLVHIYEKILKGIRIWWFRLKSDPFNIISVFGFFLPDIEPNY